MFGWVDAKRFIHDDVATVPARRVAIVPGCGVRNGQPTLVLADRLHAALALHRAGKVTEVLVSGNALQVPIMADWLIERGVAETDLVRDPAGLRTLLTMRRAARTFGVRAAVVCTNRFHIHRAVFLARAAGIDAVGLVADRNVYASRRKNAAREAVARARAIFDVYVAQLTRDRSP